MLMAGGVGLAMIGLGATAAASPSADSAEATQVAGASTTAQTCYLLSSEAIAGPYYLDYDLFRRNLVEDRTGIPLTLRFKLIDTVTCKPLVGAAVDIWNCDALGVYSGYISLGNDTAPTGAGAVPPTDTRTFLRGSQITDRSGEAEFQTIFPGWYIGRAVHTHIKVHVGGRLTKDGYESGHVCHTGQLYYDETSVIASSAVAPYNTSTEARTLLDQDRFYGGGGAADGLLDLAYRATDIRRGVTGSLTLGVDPSATNNGDGPLPTATPTPSAS
jgi:protocatechuate 3,4-dioxygenase beta subunit